MMSALIAVFVAVLILIALVGLPYGQTWYARWGE
ncbi:hypothetical protein KEK_00165 [Mycolicibacterium thermoresistibile ATCC 19527]|uniref:Uncharacterized protein n=1 Tax=Mycolicibacterium thermoresistibile (strain ATCC 19527 / DSM 44167 / CIP 105390 / JCM 6362 / NCTC 10409 / 316) TaxID=1078020 RepID=G7CAP1_MYCT3|nr:hypothetical protein KEK_00165 [Mycolicibacterium thermoresistibile ATCC 19527]